MEEYKDVMLSEPPARAAPAPVMHAVSLENYKGILLCDRPAQVRGVGGGLQRAGDGNAQPFLPSGKPEDRCLGLQPSQEHRGRLDVGRSLRKDHATTADGKPINPALSKHRRWLRSFAAAVRSMKLGEAERVMSDAARAQRLRDAEAAKREAARVDGASGAPTPPQAPDATPTPPPAAAAPAAAPKPAAAAAAAAAGKSKKKKEKPKWAMTEDEALDAELGAHAELVKFAQHLDYERFIADMEVQEALAIMRDRVRELAAERGMDLADATKAAATGSDADDDDDLASEAPSNATTTTREVHRAAVQKRREAKAAIEAAEAAAAAHDKAWNGSTTVGRSLRDAISRDALMLAEKVLASSESMRLVHTKQSLAKLLQNVALTGQTEQRFPEVTSTGAAVPAPKTSVVSAEATGREATTTGQTAAPQKRILTDLRHAKDKAQNLPYLYRCPSL